MLSVYFLAVFPLAAMASIGGHCTGSAATGQWGVDGICEPTATCASFGGVPNPAPACPNDPPDVQCCLVGLGPSADVNPCGGTSYCTWTTNGCGGSFNPASFCPGPQSYQCCEV